MTADNAAASRSRLGLWPALVALAIVAVLALYMVAYTVPAGFAAVKKYFGRTMDRAINQDGTEAGLHFKAPAPIHTVQLVDMRPRLLPLREIELATADPFTIHLMTTVEWRVTDPLGFVANYASEKAAEEIITNSVHAVRTALAQSIRLEYLISAEPGQPAQYAEFERRFREAASRNISEGAGIEITGVHLNGILLPPPATSAIIGHMGEQRRALAQRYQQEGENEVRRVRAEAESQADIIKANAAAEATSIRAEGDAAAAEALQAVSREPEAASLVLLFKAIEIMEASINPNSLFVLSESSPLFDTAFLASPRGAP